MVEITNVPVITVSIERFSFLLRYCNIFLDAKLFFQFIHNIVFEYFSEFVNDLCDVQFNVVFKIILNSIYIICFSDWNWRWLQLWIYLLWRRVSFICSRWKLCIFEMLTVFIQFTCFSSIFPSSFDNTGLFTCAFINFIAVVLRGFPIFIQLCALILLLFRLNGRNRAFLLCILELVGKVCLGLLR